jgi:hypothetical protein
MFVKFCNDITRSADICTGKNNFHNLLRKMRAGTGIEQKTSESVPSDSHRAQRPVEIFHGNVGADLSLRRTFGSRARMRGKKLPHCTQNRMQARDRRARVRVRVSFSGFR